MLFAGVCLFLKFLDHTHIEVSEMKNKRTNAQEIKKKNKKPKGLHLTKGPETSIFFFVTHQSTLPTQSTVYPALAASVASLRLALESSVE